jgi:hypothetical protein
MALPLMAACLSLSVAVAQDVSVVTSIEQATTADPSEMVENTPDWVDEMRRNVAALVALDDKVKKKTSGEGLPCVTNNLAAARSLVDMSDVARSAMSTALDAGPVNRARFEYRKVAIALLKSRGLVADSERCVFGQGLEAGKTKVNLVGGASGTQGDTEGVLSDMMSFGFDPPNASPF